MSATNKFTVPQVPGSSRSSKRAYTHAVICQFDAERYAADLPNRLSAIETNRTLADDLRYHTKVRAVGVGGVWSELGSKVDQRQFDSAIKVLAERGDTLDLRIVNAKNTEKARTARSLAQDQGNYSVLQWSQSAANAQKSIGSWDKPGAYLKNVHVVPVVQVK